MSDMKCPYCGADQEVCNDDGHGCDEDVRHEHTCSECDKTFVFTTYIRWHYTAEKADCLNDSEHKLKMSSTNPRRYSKMRCCDCDHERKPTPEEFKANGIDPENDFH